MVENMLPSAQSSQEQLTYTDSPLKTKRALWWHAHSKWLRATVYGALVILPKLGSSYPFPKPRHEVPIIVGVYGGDWGTAHMTDPSEFQDIFDVDHFITPLRHEVRILKELPPRLKERVERGLFYTMPPISWSDISYYENQILPLIRKYKVVHLNRTDTRLANNSHPLELQKLRCRVNFSALKFTPQIEELGKKVIKLLRRKGPFIVLHLRYEMDMLAFSGCTQGCNHEEVDELTKMRYAYPWWKEKIINSDLKRKDGLRPLTPEEIL